MFPTLFAVVVVLLTGWLMPATATGLRRRRGFDAWLRWLHARFPEGGFWHGRAGLVLALLPPLLAVASLQWLLSGWAFGLPALLFAVVVLFFCWGPRELAPDVEAIAEAGDAQARHAAARALWPASEQAQVSTGAVAMVEALFRSAMRRWFGVLFWFVLLGPFGALAYRLVAVIAEDEVATTLPPALVQGARGVLAVLDWPAVQLACLALALAGDFDSVVAAWKQAGGAWALPAMQVLVAAGRASVRSELADEAEEHYESGVAMGSALVRSLGPVPELRDAMSLCVRVLVLWLALVAVFVIAGWVT